MPSIKVEDVEEPAPWKYFNQTIKLLKLLKQTIKNKLYDTTVWYDDADAMFLSGQVLYKLYIHNIRTWTGSKRLKEIKSSNLICQMKCLTFSDWIKLRLSIYATH